MSDSAGSKLDSAVSREQDHGVCTHEVSRTDKIVGMVVALCGAIAFSLTAASIQMTGGRISAMENLFVRALTLSIFCLVSMLWRGIPIFGPPGTRKAIALRAVAGSISTCCYYQAVQMLRLGDALAVFSIYPVFTYAMGFAFLGEQVKLVHGVSIVLMLVGAVVIVRPGFLFGEEEGRDVNREMTGYMFCLLGSVFCAIGYFLTRLVSVRAPRDAKTATPLVFAASYGAMIGALGASFVFPDAAIRFAWVPADALIMAGGVLGGFSVQFSVAFAAKRIEAGIITMIASSDLVWGFAWQIMFFKESSNWLSYVGSVLVVASICMVSVQKLYSPSASKSYNKVADLEMMTAGDKAVGEDAEEAVAQDAEEAVAQDAEEAKGIENDAGDGDANAWVEGHQTSTGKRSDEYVVVELGDPGE